MKLIHYSAEPLTEVHSVEQIPTFSGFMKPRGLWLSVESENKDGWLEWCEGEQFNLDSFAHATQLFLRDDANILHIPSAIELFAFHKSFAADLCQDFRMQGIDWEMVASKYQGIIIAPYIWSMRLNDKLMWYYGWDCASGCIWDASAIERLEQLFEFRKPKSEEVKT